MIRKLNANDLGAYQDLRLAGLKEKPQYFGASVRDEKKTKDNTYLTGFGLGNRIYFSLGMFMGPELIGVVGFRRFTLENLRHKAALWGMYVAPRHRGKGVGTRLVEAYLKRARKVSGLETIQLAVESKNRAAKNLYSRLGFKPFAEEKRSLKVKGKYYDEIWMKLELDPKRRISPPSN